MIFVDEKMNYTQAARDAFDVIDDYISSKIKAFKFDEISLDEPEQFVIALSKFAYVHQASYESVYNVIDLFREKHPEHKDVLEHNNRFEWFFEQYSATLVSKMNMMRIRRRMKMREQK